MPITALAGGGAALSMAGVPLTLGFVGKDGAYEALLHASDWFPWLLALIVLASILLGLAALLAGVLPFRGSGPERTTAHDPPGRCGCRRSSSPRAVSLSASRPSLLDGPLSAAATAAVGAPVDVSLQHLARGHAGAPAQRAHAGSGRRRVPGASRRCGRGRGEPRYGTEDVYDGALAALNAVSRAIAPAAAQRVAAHLRHGHRRHVGRGGRRRTADRSRRSARRVPRTSITAHDVIIVFIIIAGCGRGDRRAIDDGGRALARCGRLRRRHDRFSASARPISR